MVKRRRGLVVYVSSGSSTQPTPMQSSYAAGKKLLDKLALDMNIEYKEHNIDFQSIKVLRLKKSNEKGAYLFKKIKK